MTFADKLTPHVKRLGAVECARICGVTDRTIRAWINNRPGVNAATQAGAIALLRAAKRRAS
jgi:hypothetical protein